MEDHFVTSYASDLNSRLYERRAQICDDGGTAEFRALFDTEGNIMPAKQVTVPNRFRGGTDRIWGVLESDDPNSKIVQWIRTSEAEKAERRRATDAKKGVYVGTVKASAAADLEAPAGATGIGGVSSVYVSVFRLDGGFSRSVEVLDSGSEPT